MSHGTRVGVETAESEPLYQFADVANVGANEFAMGVYFANSTH